MSTLPVHRLLLPAAALVATAWFAPAALAATTDTIDKTFAVAAGGTLTIDVDAGSIELKAIPGDTVAVRVERTFRASSQDKEQEMLAGHTVTIEQSGNDVSIHARDASRLRSWRGWFGGMRREIRYIVSVPTAYHADLKTAGGPIAAHDLHGTLRVRTSGGPLHLAGIRGPIDGGTSGGPIRLERCEGEVDLHTSGGPIHAEACAGRFKLGSSGGGIAVQDHRGTLDLHTSGGGISVDNLDGAVNGSTSGGPVAASFRGQPTGDCRLHTSGGGVSLRVPADAQFSLEARTSGGGVSCSLAGGTDLEKSRGRLRATYNGGGPTIELTSSGGGISIDATRGVGG